VRHVDARRSSLASRSSNTTTSSPRDPDVTVWVATADDAELVGDLIAESSSPLPPTASSQYLLSALGVTPHRGPEVEGLFGDPAVTVVLGAFSGAPCAIAVTRWAHTPPSEVVATTVWLYVAEPFRRCGVGEALVRTIDDLIASRGGGVHDVLTAPGNRALKVLLENAGLVGRAIVMSHVVRGLPEA
jgi:GNAT superfamily N-acetyltransferase